MLICIRDTGSKETLHTLCVECNETVPEVALKNFQALEKRDLEEGHATVRYVYFDTATMWLQERFRNASNSVFAAREECNYYEAVLKGYDA